MSFLHTKKQYEEVNYKHKEHTLKKDILRAF